MSRADARERITRAAIALGAAEGVGALTLQAIARRAGVSKALLLYHFRDKAALLVAVVGTLGTASEQRLRRAAAASDAMDAWRTLVRDECASGEVALLAALALEREVEPAGLAALRAARESAAAALAGAVLDGLQLTPRVSPALLGRLLLRQLDGVAASVPRPAAAPGARSDAGPDAGPDAELDAEFDAFALALLALGR